MVWRVLAPLLCLIGGLVAGGVQAAVTHDPALRWQTLHTGHFRVHFHEGIEPQARRAAALAEQIHERLTPLIGWQPLEPVEIVLTDRVDVANGYASVFPADRLTIYLTPPDEVEGLEDHGGWLETVLVHEYLHILHLDRADDAPDWLRDVFGRNILLFPNALQPRWLIEGIATWFETDRSRGIGRGQSSYYDMLMRLETVHGLKPVRQINQPIVTWPGYATPYLYGVNYFNFLVEQGGEQRIRALVDDYSSNLIPFRINTNSKTVLGGDLDAVWPQFQAYLQEHHEPQLAAIRDRGVVAGERLTRDGYATGAARALPDGSIVYVRVDGRREPALMRRAPDGHERRLAGVHTAAHLSVHAEAGALLAQPERTRNANYFYDLYRVDLATGRVVRLTRGGRYRYGAFSPDGTRILAVHNQGGRHRLHLLDADGRLREELFAGEPDTVFADPDWAPDGASVVLAAWRPRSGWNLERFWIAERRFQPLTQDAAIEAQPRFTADGTAVLFSSDHGGVYNLRRLALASGRVETLTNVEGGAFHPAPGADGVIYYTGYGVDGFDIYRLAASASLPTPAAAAGPSAVVATEPSPVDDVRVGDYSPYYGLRPRWWLPLLWIDSQRTELGLMTSGWDALQRHLYYLTAAYDFDNDWAVGSFDYIYDRYYPTFKLHVARQNTLYLDAADEPQRITNSDTYLGEVVLPFLYYRRQFALHAAGYSVRDSDDWTAAGIAANPDRIDNVLGIAAVYDSTRRYPLSISRSHGLQLSLAAETSDAIAGSSYTGEVYTFDGRAFLPLGREHVLALRMAYGWGSRDPRQFVLGSSRSAGEAPLPLDTAVVSSPFDQRRFALRGYDSGQPGLVGRRMVTAAAEWRFPLARVERGFMAPPAGLQQLYGTLFAEAGDAWNDGRHPDDIATGAGAEAHADVMLFYDLPLHLRLGYAYGFADSGGSHAYLQIGSSF